MQNLALTTLGGFVLMRHTFEESVSGNKRSVAETDGTNTVATVELRAPLELKVQVY